MQLHNPSYLLDKSHPADSIQHDRYGPYFVYPSYRRSLEFGGGRSFELLIAAFRDPRVTPERSRGMLNGIVLIWHGTEHEVIIFEGLHCADRVHREAPTQNQLLEFHRLSHISWEELVCFCRGTPATRSRWRQEGTWVELTDSASGVRSALVSSSETHLASL